LLVGGAALVGAAHPASAADMNNHTLGVTGSMRITDFDSPDNDDICARSTEQSINLQFPGSAAKTFTWTASCDEVEIRLRGNATIDADGTITIRFAAELWEEDCTVWICDSDRITTKRWTATVPITTGPGTNNSAFVDGGDEGNSEIGFFLLNTVG
jgi:hypothetical protein